jgi:hypothetical protein
MSQRFKLPPGGDVSPEAAARRMGLTAHAFDQALPTLLARGFPAPDPTTGNFDLDAIDAWRRTRNPHLFPQATQGRLIASPTARDASDVVPSRLARARSG